MSPNLGMEDYAVVPYNPHQDPSYNSFTDTLHNDALMSPSFAYPDPNEGLWRMIDTLPQLSNVTNVPIHDGFASQSSVNHNYATTSHRGAYPAPARPSASATTRSTNHITTEPLTAPTSYIPHSSAPKQAQLQSSELHLCKACCAAVQALISYGTTIHLVQDTCAICRGASSAPAAKDDGIESSHRDFATSVTAQKRPIVHQPPKLSSNRVNKQKHRRTRSSKRYMGQSSSRDREGPFHCQHKGCNRGLGGKPFARRDNRNVHERAVHGAGAAEALEVN